MAFVFEDTPQEQDYLTQLVPDQSAAPIPKKGRFVFEDTSQQKEHPKVSMFEDFAKETQTIHPRPDQHASPANSDSSPEPSFIGSMIDNAAHGVKSLGDLVTGNYQDIGNARPTPKTEALGEKLFPKDSQKGTLEENIGDFLMNAKHNTQFGDYAGALLEKFGETPEGKAVAGIGGLIPSFNAVGTAIQKYVNPALENLTGASPDTIALAEIGLSPLGLKGAKTSKMSSLPEVKITKALTAPIHSPLKTAGFIVDSASSLMKPLVQPIAKSILESENPVFGGNLKADLASETASEGMRLGKSLGVDFSAGELTGNKTAMGIEDALSNSPRWAQQFAKANTEKTNKIIGKFNETLDKIYPEGSSKTDVGVSLGNAYRGTLDSLVKTRREQAKIDFKAALQGGKKESPILSNNLFRELQAIKSEGEAKLLTKSKSHGAALARNILSRVSSKTKKGNIQADTISLVDMANGLSDFSSEAMRPGNILDNAKSAAERRVYARLFGALQKDLDAEILQPKGSAERAAMLAVARDNFAKHSNQISDIQKTTLGKVIGKAAHDSEGNLVVSPELIADRFVKMQPTELRNTLKFLDKNHPEVSQMARRHILERALRIAVESKGLRGEGTTKDFAKSDFIKNLPDQEKLTALLGDSTSASEVRDVAAAMNRLIDYGSGIKGSQTFGRTEFLKGIGKWAKDAFYNAVVSDTLAQELMNPVKRKKLAYEARKFRPQIKGD